MSTPAYLVEDLRRIVMQPSGGIVGLVDELLKACSRHNLQLDWQPDRCRIRCGQGNWEELTGLTPRKSVFRAVLARIAVLCNARVADSVSPYGGRGELAFGPDSSVVFTAVFSNTAGQQKLSLSTKGAASNGADKTNQCSAESGVGI